jgi:hypothetical protein
MKSKHNEVNGSKHNINSFSSSALHFFTIVIAILHFKNLLHIANAHCKTPLKIDFIYMGNKEITLFLTCAA